MMDRQRYVDLIERLHLTYPEATYGWRGNLAKVTEIWAEQLGDLPMEAVDAAVKRWIATQPKMPHISDIRSLIADAVAPVPSEGEAWNEGLRWIRRGDGYETSFGAQIMARLGNRRDLGQMTVDGKGGLREQFGWEYRRMAGEERAERVAGVGELATVTPLRAIS